MGTPLRAILVCDLEADSLPLKDALQRGGYAPDLTCVSTVAAARSALATGSWHLVLVRRAVPGLCVQAVMALLHEFSQDIPVVLVTDGNRYDEIETALAAGARDYVDEHDLFRLVVVVQRELRDALLRQEYRQSEAALRASEARFRRYFELGLVGMAISSPDRAWLEVNDYLCEVLGYTKTELLQKSWVDVTHPDDIEADLSAFQQVLSGELDRYSLDKRFVHKDGSIIHTIMSTTCLRHADDSIDCFLMLIQDITDRKRTEEALNQRQRELESLLETSRDLSSALDLDELLMLIAQRAVELLAADECTLFRLNQADSMLHPILALGQYADEKMAQTLRIGQGITGTSVAENRPILANDVLSDPRAYQVRGTPLTDENLMAAPLVFRDTIIGGMLLSRLGKKPFSDEALDLFVGFAQHAAIAMQNAWLYQSLESYSESLEQAVDSRTRELRKTKESVEAILKSSPDAILMLGTKGTIETINETFGQMFGYRLEEVLYQSPIILAEPSRSEVFQEMLRVALEEGMSGRLGITAQRRNGGTFDADVALAPIKESGYVTGLVCSIRDISALKEVERMKDAFVSNVTHELRTPITSIRLYHDLLVQNPGREEIYMERLKRETGRLEHIIDDLLYLSRLDQGKVTLVPVPIDLNALAGQYVVDRTPLAARQGLQLSFEGGPDLPLVHIDRGLMGQALSILVTNALNYTPPGGQVMVETLARHTAGKQWVGLQVKDTGPGILPDEQPRLFERFFRGIVGRESGRPGTGLGLSLLQEIVRRHFGWVEVISQGIPGEGATFIIWLPT